MPDHQPMNTKTKWVLTALSIISTLVVTGGGVWAGAEKIDSRYMKVATYEQNEIDKLEDQIFELELKLQQGVATPVERAMLERYKQRLQALRARQKT